jgi:hypothetical protein
MNITDEERQKSLWFPRAHYAFDIDLASLALTGKLVLVDLAGSENNKVRRQLGVGYPIFLTRSR